MTLQERQRTFMRFLLGLLAVCLAVNCVLDGLNGEVEVWRFTVAGGLAVFLLMWKVGEK
jgi:hypothetical protein